MPPRVPVWRGIMWATVRFDKRARGKSAFCSRSWLCIGAGNEVVARVGTLNSASKRFGGGQTSEDVLWQWLWMALLSRWAKLLTTRVRCICDILWTWPWCHCWIWQRQCIMPQLAWPLLALRPKLRNQQLPRQLKPNLKYKWRTPNKNQLCIH